MRTAEEILPPSKRWANGTVQLDDALAAISQAQAEAVEWSASLFDEMATHWIPGSDKRRQMERFAAQIRGKASLYGVYTGLLNKE